jgi:hypothetical protein
VKKYFIAVVFFCSLTSIAHASSVSRFIFSTSPQIVAPNTISLPVTVESQDGTGNMVQIPETYDLMFVTSSATGQFVTSGGKKLSTTTTMSKNTANRTVYYEDSSVGNFTLTLTATARTSKDAFTVSQKIIVATPTAVVPVKATSVVPVVLTTQSQNVPIAHTGNQIQTESQSQSASATQQVSTTTLLPTQTADVSQAQVVFTAPVQTDLIHRIFAWPIRITDAVYRFFFGQ